MYYENNITRKVKTKENIHKIISDYVQDEIPDGYYLSFVDNIYGEVVELTFSPFPTPDCHREPFDFSMAPFSRIGVDKEGRSYVCSTCTCGGCYWSYNYIVDEDSFTARGSNLVLIEDNVHLKNVKISAKRIYMRESVKLTNVEIVACEWLQVGKKLISHKNIDQYFRSISI